MVEGRDPHYEETNNPKYPPKAVMNRGVRRATLWTFVGPLLVLTVVVGIALLYWMGREPGRSVDDDSYNPATGTSGEQIEKTEPTNPGLQQGGGDPAPKPGNTQDELEFRTGRDAR